MRYAVMVLGILGAIVMLIWGRWVNDRDSARRKREALHLDSLPTLQEKVNYLCHLRQDTDERSSQRWRTLIILLGTGSFFVFVSFVMIQNVTEDTRNLSSRAARETFQNCLRDNEFRGLLAQTEMESIQRARVRRDALAEDIQAARDGTLPGADLVDPETLAQAIADAEADLERIDEEIATDEEQLAILIDFSVKASCPIPPGEKRPETPTTITLVSTTTEARDSGVVLPPGGSPPTATTTG